MDIKNYIDNRLNPQIEWYDKKSIRAQKIYKRLQVIEIIVASSIPILSGYAISNRCIALIIGICGSLIAVIESISKLNKYHENWIEYRSTCELLIYQKHLYLTESFPYNKEDETLENIFVKNIENIISSENNKWKNINYEGEESNLKNQNN